MTVVNILLNKSCSKDNSSKLEELPEQKREGELVQEKAEVKKLASFLKQASEQSHGPMIGPSNDIYNELKFDYVDNFDKHNSSFPNGVSPLQYHTNEKYQVSHQDMSRGYDDKLLLLGSNITEALKLQMEVQKRLHDESSLHI
uniref:MYB-CC type transcription factor LHEQLE-containing domain-containing protein n=1 Tax=Lactuca sativa TaxID=4236 RepID=A0A9R1VZR5_LACSA|nr:hypothetical protein LSAT_V11C400204880 [Lactuca sativa]